MRRTIKILVEAGYSDENIKKFIKAGWWNMKSPDEPGVNFDFHKDKDQFANAIPGEDDENLLYNGDGPADILSAAIHDVIDEYINEWNRPPKFEEIMGAFNFVMQGATEKDWDEIVEYHLERKAHPIDEDKLVEEIEQSEAGVEV